MASIHIGCAGWAYADWKGGFYPRKLPESAYLGHYSRYFDLVEVNTTFYHTPNKETVANWLDRTPTEFKFTIKLSQQFSHKFNLSITESEISQFFYNLSPLEPKISAYLLQFPPNFRNISKNLSQLKFLMANFPQNQYVVEFRHPSWFNQENVQLFADHPHWAFATSYLADNAPFFPPEQKIYYIRMIGDRNLTQFGQIQRDNADQWQSLLSNLHTLSIPEITDIFVIFNNHFRGFAPQDVVDLKKALKIPQKPFNTQKDLKFLLKKPPP